MQSAEDLNRERASIIEERARLLSEQAGALREANAALKDALGTAEKLMDEYQKRVAKLEDDRAKSRRRTMWAVIFAAIAGAIVSR